MDYKKSDKLPIFTENLKLRNVKQIVDFFCSMRLTAFIMVIFAVSIAVATFIENDFGVSSARKAVYAAKWFELLLFIGMINLIGMIFRRKLYQKEKSTIFLFHFAFALIITGAGITRYFGFEGTLSVREGESSGSILTDECYLQVSAGSEQNTIMYHDQVEFTAIGKNRYNKTIDHNDQRIHIRLREYIPNAVTVIEPDPEGSPAAEFVYVEANERKNVIVIGHHGEYIDSQLFTFDSLPVDTPAVRLTATENALFFRAPFDVYRMDMRTGTRSVLGKDSLHRFASMQAYDFQDNMLVLNHFLSNARISAAPAESSKDLLPDALKLEIIAENYLKELIVRGKSGSSGTPQTVMLGQIPVTISYGSVYKNIPFKIQLQDFIIDRYPGSNSPSWFESKVMLIDPDHDVSEIHRIYMNHVLKYKGYRFYQSSYDTDEKGTILSVNHDPAGTVVTYCGYFIMALGMILSIFNRKSRFRYLTAQNKALKQGKIAFIAILAILMIPDWVSGQSELPVQGVTLEVNHKHAEMFATLLVQDKGGRIEPVNTLSSEVLRKIYRKSEYNGITSDQVFLAMFADPGTWQYENIIRVSHKQIQEIMGNKGRYYAFADFFSDNHYILQDYVEEAYRKIPAYRSKFDTEMIRLDERINICYLVFTGDLLRIFPVSRDSSNTWYGYRDIQGRIDTADSLYVENLIPLYVRSVQEGMRSGNWQQADDLLKSLLNLQQSYASEEMLPADRKVSVEIFLNRADIFKRISNVYAITGFVLLLLQLIRIFRSGIRLKIPVMISTWIIIIAFMAHTAGIVMRWYVSGHAPWSNGYEVLIYIAWVTILAGLVFSGRSSLTLSSTSILAFLILNTAHLSWMDPQITNLVPVLQSYWLVIHVATITASYGFLGLAALLGFIDLVLIIFQTEKNYASVETTIHELSNIIEMALIAGLYLLVVGAFLGGVWANESWGRYWGWDPKETWTLVTILTYAFIVHMRMIPGCKGLFNLNLGALLGLGTVIMTYFGVNYYLSGLHSYAGGDPLPVPGFVYFTLIVVIVVSLSALIKKRKLKTIN